MTTSYFNSGLSSNPFGEYTANDFAPNTAALPEPNTNKSGGFMDSLGGFTDYAFSTEGSGMLGGFASGLGSKGGEGTGGMFTSLGSLAGPWGSAAGAILDIGFSSSMANKAQSKAKKAAKSYWKDAKKELEELKRMQAYEFGGLQARQGGTGIQFKSVTPQLYRAEFQRQQLFQYNKMKKQMKAQRDAIKKSGGKGGLF